MGMMLLLCACACSGGGRTEEKVNDAAKRKVIIDTDTGADDASALIMAARDDSIDILGVTTLAGNVDIDQAAKNALAALEVAGSRVDVYRGSKTTFDGKNRVVFSVFGKDGMGDAGLVKPKTKPQKKDAVDFIISAVKKNPGEVEIVALGPATNIAKAMKKDPKTMKKVKRIWSLGTAGLGAGNASPVAEFNVYADALAYKKMLDFNVPVTIVGLDMCDGEAMWTDAQFEELGKSGKAGKFVAASFAKIREFYEKNGSEGTVMNCDPVLMTAFLDSDYITDKAKYHGSCITDEGETYAQVIFYKKGFTYDMAKNDMKYNVTLVTGAKDSEYFERYLNRIKE